MDIVGFLNSTGTEFTNFMTAIRFPLGASQNEKDVFALELAKTIKMKPNGLAAEYLDHFLSGKATDKKFDTMRLLREDIGVKNRVVDEVSRRALGIRTLREKAEDSRMSLSAVAQRDRHLITVFQKTYKLPDWQLALGTFTFDWEVIYETEEAMTVNLWGSNKYQWHPNSQRMTQFLHQAGARLHNNRYAAPKNFDIVAAPAQLKVSKKNKLILEMSTFVQTNPRHFKVLI
jgi:hypothetical protein